MIFSDPATPAEAFKRKQQVLTGLRAGGKPVATFRDHASLLRPGSRPRSRTARIVPVCHALLEKGVARRALEPLVVRAEFARRHFLLRIDSETWPRRYRHDQGGRHKRVTRHANPRELLYRYDSTTAAIA